MNLLGVTYEVVHFQACDTLMGSIGNKVAASHAVHGCRVYSSRGCTDLYYARGDQGVLLMRVGVRPVNWI